MLIGRLAGEEPEAMRGVKMPPLEVQQRKEAADLLKKFRREKGLTGQQLADRIGISRSAVTHWESAYRPLSDLAYVRRILEVLNPDPQRRQQFLQLLGIEAAVLDPTTSPREVVALVNRKLERLQATDEAMARLALKRLEQTKEIRRLVRAHGLELDSLFPEEA
jgi:transcriptional regulator with XRE-family HTH domain